MNNRELEKNDRSICQCENDNSILVQGTQHSRRFTFDNVFDVAAAQEEVFHYSGIKRLVDMSIEGYVKQIFNY